MPPKELRTYREDAQGLSNVSKLARSGGGTNRGNRRNGDGERRKPEDW